MYANDAEVKALVSVADEYVPKYGVAGYFAFDGGHPGWGIGVRRSRGVGYLGAYGEWYELSLLKVESSDDRVGLRFSGIAWVSPFSLRYRFYGFTGAGVSVETVQAAGTRSALLFALEAGLLVGLADGRVLLELRVMGPRDWAVWSDDGYEKVDSMATVLGGITVPF